MQAHALKSDVMCILPNWRCEETRAAGRRTHQPITAGCKRCAHVQAFSPPVASAQKSDAHHPGQHKATAFAQLPGI